MIAEYLKSSTKETVGVDNQNMNPGTRTPLPHVTSLLRGMLRSAIRVISFDTAIYADVAGNRGASLQALTIVFLSAIAAGVPAYFGAGFAGTDRFVSQMFLAIVGWVLWVSITYFVGTQLFRKRVTGRDWQSLARALGFAQSVGILRVLGLIPGLGVALTLVILVWIFITSVLAIRGALEIESYRRAIGVATISLVPFLPLMAFLSLLMIRS